MELGGRKNRRMLERMGLDMNQIPDVKEVIIRTSTKDLVVREANVSEINAKGMRVFQVMGNEVEEIEHEKPKFTEEDVLLVAQQAGVSKERASAALEESNGDLAQAILQLSS
ncbi:MAG: nascent polypeptide-associated complex protein [Nitrososphaerales archaeon]|nr:nascent polypeptide-associated complex protein [Nitrososphaerales archaeon]